MVIRALTALSVLFWASGCGRFMSTQEFLDSTFVTTRSLVLTVPGDIIYDGKDFDARLEGHANSESGILTTMGGNITWALTGGGTLTQVNCPPMSQGVQICRMRYSGGLTTGQTKVIKLKATHVDSGQSTSEGFTVATQSFSVSVPSRINANTNFTATITATDPYGNTNTSYSGTVIPYLALMPGRPNVEEISNFVNGVATVQMLIHKPAWQMQLVVYDKVNANYSGTSNTFRVIQTDGNYASLDLVAVPLSATSNRLSWTYLDATLISAYKIYRKDSAGAYQLLFTETTTTKSFYLDTSLTTGTSYDYKVEAVNSGGSVISTDFASSVPKACTAISVAPTAYTAWSKAQSPYCLTATMTLGAPVTIEPGAIILFNTGAVLTINSLFQVIGAPNNRIIFASINNAQDGTAGINVSNPSPSIMDASYNYVSGSGFKYFVWDYLGGAYWQKPIFYGQTLWRYSNGIAFENLGAGDALNTVLDGFMFIRGAVGNQIFGSQTGIVQNGIAYRNIAMHGALHVKNGSAGGNMDIRITGTYFALNASTTGGAASGGAITADPQNTNNQTGTIRISDCQFYDNTSPGAGYNGGAIRLLLRGTPTYIITNNTFSGNSANANGGAISIEATVAMTASAQLTSNSFTGNSAPNGGAIRIGANVASTAFTITNNQFSGNSAGTAGKNFFNGIALNHNLQFSYWDGATDTTCAAPNRLALGIADSCGGGGSGTVNAANGVSTTYPLCIADPTASNCVGAR